MIRRIAVAAVLAAASAAVAQETWPFEPGEDALDAGAMLDLRPLNEEVAGEHGFVRLSDDGNSFVRGDGEPIRFWAVNDMTYERLDMAALERHAEFLAKRGVNMARYHGNVPSRREGATIADINEEARDELWKYVAAFKKSGIYLTISPYYPHSTDKTKDAWGVPADSEGMTGLIYFHPDVQAAYKTWLRELMVPANPYTGVALKDDASIAIVQMQNEDSLLFWTVNTIKGVEAEMLADRFGQFLKEKYGSLEQAKAAWKNAGIVGVIEGGVEEDDWASGRIAVSNVWHLTQPPPSDEGAALRLADQVEFFTTLMRDWHAEVQRYLREDIGSQSLFNAGNWRTADNLRLDDQERYSYALDGAIVGLNRYTTSLHKGEAEGWALTTGDLYTNESALRDPSKLQVSVKQPEGHPYIFPECLWVPPMWYQAEGPWLTAAYSSLNGTDIAYWFANGVEQWYQPQSANGYLPSVGKWTLATPGHLGMFPAAAIIFRRGYLDEGEPVVVEHRTPEEMWRRDVPLLGLEGAYDPNRDAEAAKRQERTPVSPDAFLVGPVRVTYDEGEDEVADLAKFVKGDVVSSNTGQLAWDKAVGFATMNADRAQGAAGFLADAGAIELADVTITYDPPEHADSETAKNTGYAAVSVVSLDDLPLSQSRKVLVQVGTVARPSGWQIEPAKTDDGEEAHRVVEFGKAPWSIEAATNLTVAFRNDRLRKATALDPNGMPVGEAKVERGVGNLTLAFPPNALYVIVE